MVTWEERILPVIRNLKHLRRCRIFRMRNMPKTLGLAAWRGRPDDIVAAIEEGLAADRPTLLEFVCDPEVPPLAAAHFARAGDEFHEVGGQG